MPAMRGPLAGAGSPGQARPGTSFARRVGSVCLWWVMLMGFWTWIDDSVDVDELLVGAAVALLGAILVEVALHQAGSSIRLRARWLLRAWRLPGQVGRDTAIVFAALWRTLSTGRQPPSGFLEVGAAWGDDTPEGDTRRTLLIAGMSVAPNTIALGIDPDREVMVVHRLVLADTTENGSGPTRRGREE